MGEEGSVFLCMNMRFRAPNSQRVRRRHCSCGGGDKSGKRNCVSVLFFGMGSGSGEGCGCCDGDEDGNEDASRSHPNLSISSNRSKDFNLLQSFSSDLKGSVVVRFGVGLDLKEMKKKNSKRRKLRVRRKRRR